MPRSLARLVRDLALTSFLSTAALAAPALAAEATVAQPPVLEPTTQAFIDSLKGAKPIYTLTPDQARALLHNVQSHAANLPPVQIEDRSLAIGPRGETRIRILRPEGQSKTGAAPVIIYFHGAGWVMGDTTTHDRLVRDLATGTGATVVFVDYDRSPEARYPVAIEEDYAVLSYVAQHAAAFGIDPARLAIAGDSVGGNMTAVVSILDKERHGPAIRAQVLFYPVTDAAMTDGSYKTFANGPWLTAKAMHWFWNAYLPNVKARADIHVSPLHATVDELRGLPPALVITDENDVLRDEGEAYARKLIAAGVPVTATRYLATIHDFVMLNALAGTPAAQAATEQAVDYLNHALKN